MAYNSDQWRCVRCCHAHKGWKWNDPNPCEMCGGKHVGTPERPICSQGRMRVYQDRHGLIEYTYTYPEGAWVLRGSSAVPGHELMFPGSGMHAGYPGGYLHASIVNDRPRGGRGYRVVVTDRDDGLIEKEVDTLEEALMTMQTLKDMSPCTQGELVGLGIGFIWD